MPSQQVDALKRQRDRYLEEVREVGAVRRKEPELQTLKHQIDSLENRLSFSRKDREVTVSPPPLPVLPPPLPVLLEVIPLKGCRVVWDKLSMSCIL